MRSLNSRGGDRFVDRRRQLQPVVRRAVDLPSRFA
jgi:hypothetical protein